MYKPSKKQIGIASLLLIGVLFGLSGVIAKYLSSWLNPYQVVEYRFLIAFIIAILIVFSKGQKIKFGKISFKTLGLFSVTFPVSVILFTLSIFNTSVSLAVFSFYLATLIGSFAIGKLYFKEEITANKKIALLFIILAVIALTNPLKGFTIELGFAYGIASGLFQAITSTFQKIVSKSANKIALLIIQTLTGALMSAAILLTTNQSILPTLPLMPGLVAVAFGAIFLGIAYLFLVGFKHTNLNTGSILVSTELFFGPFFAFLLLSESLTPLEITGGTLTGVAVYFTNKKDKEL